MATKKKITTKRNATTRSRAKSKQVVYQTFKVASDFPTFFEARVSRQTFYWSALLLFIIIMQLIIIAINVNATLTLDNIKAL
jgi:hypothetical protein